ALNGIAKTVAETAADIKHVRSLIDSERAADAHSLQAPDGILDHLPVVDAVPVEECSRLGRDRPADDGGCPCCDDPWDDERTSSPSAASVAEQASEAIIARVEPPSDQDYYGNLDRCEDDSGEGCVGACENGEAGE